jgi:serine/threonine protein kinase
MSRRPTDSIPVGSTLLGRYRVTGVLARGGQAVVYAARGPDGESLAVKVGRPEGFDLRADERLRLEAEVLAAVDSPGVVRLVEAGVDGPTGAFCLVEALVPGVSLGAVLERGERLSPGEVLSLLEQVATALAAIHATGYVMRDLSPAQVLVARDGPGLRAVLVDLGLARPTTPDTGLTDPAAVAGTPGFVAPELAERQTPTPAADVYSLAVLAYALLAGRMPFGGPTAETVVAAQLAGAVPPIPPESGLGRAARRSLQDELVRALSPRPEERPSSPGELVVRLRTVLGSRPTRSRFLAAAVLATLLALAALGTWWLTR